MQVISGILQFSPSKLVDNLLLKLKQKYRMQGQQQHIASLLQGKIESLKIQLVKLSEQQSDLLQVTDSTQNVVRLVSSWLFAMRVNAGLMDYDVADRLQMNTATATKPSVVTKTEPSTAGLTEILEPEQVVQKLQSVSRVKRPTSISRLLRPVKK